MEAVVITKRWITKRRFAQFVLMLPLRAIATGVAQNLTISRVLKFKSLGYFGFFPN